MLDSGIVIFELDLVFEGQIVWQILAYQDGQ